MALLTRRPGKTRDTILTDLWCKHGCPERMTIRVKSTGETISLLNGLPVTLTAEKKPVLMPTSKAQNRGLRVSMPVTLTRTCEGCRTQFQAARETARFCSMACRKRVNRKLAEERRRLETAQLLANLPALANAGSDAR